MGWMPEELSKMAMVGGGTAGTGSVIDPGTYKATISKADFKPNQPDRFNEGEFVDQVHLVFTVLSDIEGGTEWSGEELGKVVTAKTGPGATLLKIARAAFSQPDLPEYSQIDTDDLVNKVVWIDVVLGKERGDGEHWRNIDGVKMVKRTTGRRVPPAAPPADPDEDVFEDTDAA